MKLYVYCLQDPRDNSPHYVGLTKNTEKRLRWHLNACRNGNGTGGKNEALFAWIGELVSASLMPDIRVLEECDGENEGMAAEAKWVAHYGHAGYRLFNQRGGGTYHTWSEAARKRASEIAKQQIRVGKRIMPVPGPEARAVIAQKSRERGQDPARFIALNKSRIGKPLSEEHRRKLSERGRGRKWTEESKAKLSESAKLREMRKHAL